MDLSGKESTITIMRPEKANRCFHAKRNFDHILKLLEELFFYIFKSYESSGENSDRAKELICSTIDVC